MTKKSPKAKKESPPATEIIVGKDITVAHNTFSDWWGLYVDGRLALEGSDLRGIDVLSALNVPFSSVPVDDDWLDERGTLPIKLADIKKKKTSRVVKIGRDEE